jgi:hypothetical protein
LLAISLDEPAASRSFASSYGIGYPLLTDPNGTTSRAYVGIDATDTPIPGIVVIRRDGQIVFRQIAEAKDDRLTAAQVLATIDRTLGITDGAPAARTGYAVLERAQLRVALGGGRSDGERPIAVASASALFPLGRRFLIGPAVRVEPLDAPLDLDLAVVMRFPILADAAALELTALGGYTPWGASDWNAGVRGGAWVALDPWWAMQLEAGAAAHRLGSDAGSTVDWTITLGVSRLIELR